MFRFIAVLASAAMVFTGPAEAQDSSPGYHVVKRFALTDGWWDYASFDPVHRRLFVSRGDGVFKMDVDSGIVDQQVIPGAEGRATVVLPGGDRLLSTMAGYSDAILFDALNGKVHKLFDLRQAPDAAVGGGTR